MDAQGYPDSWYAATANTLPAFPTLDETVDCDVCVVGGGYTGLSTALHLAERGYEVVLLEAQKIGWGASGRNGGQLGSGQRVEQDDLESRHGRETARRLWDLAEESKSTVRELIARHAIDCDYKPGILHASHKPALADAEMRYAEKLQTEYGYQQIRPVSREEMRDMIETDAYFGGSIDTGAGHLHPLNFALGLGGAAQKAGVRIFEHSPVLKLREQGKACLVTERGRVRPRFTVLACNGYLGRIEPRLASRIMPINNFILATEPLDEALARRIIRDDVAVADSKFVINYYRLSEDRRLLFGGGENYSPNFPKDLHRFVRKYMLKIYPQLSGTRIDYAWGGTLAITLNRMPHIGRLDGDIYYAQGFSGHGVGMATLSGKLIAEAVAGSAERFDVFARLPSHSFPGGRWLRYPAQVAGMLYYSLRDRL
ncbi:MAG: FAD-binding oxidoreductase [Gammaproteobacteria bacterium]|nr:FAD-binding oxidoreductase [Gammaproteobacteria bacterium]